VLSPPSSPGLADPQPTTDSHRTAAHYTGSRRDAEPAHQAIYADTLARCMAAQTGPYGDVANRLYLMAIGTRPAFKRRGLASALTRWGMERARRDGAVIALVATPTGRFLYERLGFEYRGDEITTADDANLSAWAMGWDPKAHDADQAQVQKPQFLAVN